MSDNKDFPDKIWINDDGTWFSHDYKEVYEVKPYILESKLTDPEWLAKHNLMPIPEKCEDQRLICEVDNSGRLVISIGVTTLSFADQERIGIKVNNPLEYAKDVANEMKNDNDIGATPLTEFLDKMMQSARDNGSMWVDDETHDGTGRSSQNIKYEND